MACRRSIGSSKPNAGLQLIELIRAACEDGEDGGSAGMQMAGAHGRHSSLEVKAGRLASSPGTI